MRKLLFWMWGCLACYQSVASAAYPEHAITIVVPFAAGSATDNIVRALASKLSPKLNVPIIVEDRAGANGIIGTSHGAKAEHDGYTLTAITGTTIAQNPWMFKDMSYDPLKDFQAVGRLGGFTLAIVVKADSPYHSYSELLSDIRQGKNNVSYATSYGMQTVCGEMVGRDAGGKVLSVPYKSSPQSMVDLMGGMVTFVCADLATSLSGLNGKTIKALTVLMPEGSRYLPDVVPVQKSWPKFPAMQSWVGIAAPTGIPQDRLKILSDAVYSVALDPDFAKSLAAVGFASTPMDAQKFTAYMHDEYSRWKMLIQQAGIVPQ
ncbi:MAG TPA: tripartite tricarboxylate transporter substrate binding protein [Bordetella sp.]